MRMGKSSHLGVPISMRRAILPESDASGASLGDLQEFTRVESDFYPELERHYANVIDEWYKARLAEL